MNEQLADSVYWHFPILIVVISLVYSATRYERAGDILREAFSWGFRMTFFLVAIGIALFAINRFDIIGMCIVGAVIAIGSIAMFVFNKSP